MTGLRRMARAVAIACAGVFLAAAVSGCAGYYPALDGSDRQHIATTTQSALEGNRTGESATWQNPASGRQGSVTPTRTFEASTGAPCREFSQTLGNGGQATTAQDTACRGSDGLWRSVNYVSLAGATAGDERYYDPWDYPYYGYPYYGYTYYRYPYYGYRYPRYRYVYPNYGFSYFHFGYRSGRRHGRRGHGFRLGYGYGHR